MRQCNNCNSELKGRSDKKFCSDFCRNDFNWRNGSGEKRKKHYKENKDVYLKKQKKYNLEFRERRLLQNARARSVKFGLKFDLKESDIFIPEFCPLLGLKLQSNIKGMQESSASLDRIIPELGYIKGNVWVISWKANKAKSNLSDIQLEMFCENLLEKLRSIKKA